MTTVPPAAVATEILRQGGSAAQAWVGAALVDGIESSGDPQAKNPSSTACGLFQFLTTTWQSNGGGAFAPTACQATWQQQVTIFLKASAGSNFYPWAPDLGGSYNGNAHQPAATAPQPGSPVANKIASLASGGTLKFLGNVPTNWADAGAALAGPPTPNPLVNSPSGVAGVPNLPGVLDPLQWADALGHILTDLLSADWWKRVGLFAAGLVLVIGGTILFISTTKTGERVESDAVLAAAA